jgi:hypothetical protein
MITVDMSDVTKRHLLVNRTSDLTANTYTDDTLAFYRGQKLGVGATGNAGASPWNGEIAEVLFYPGVYLDLSVASVAANFASSDGQDESRVDQHRQNPGPDAGPKQVGYGATGSLPSGGTNPYVYVSGNFEINKGTGPNFDINGAPTASRGPLIYRQSALRSTPGERWFDSERSGFSYPRSETFIEQREGISSFGKRLGKDEEDAPTRQERPGLSFSQIILGTPGLEDDSEENR